MVIGIPTFKREKNYLIRTLEAIFKDLSPEEKNHTQIILLEALSLEDAAWRLKGHKPTNSQMDLKKKMAQMFPNETKAQIIQIYEAPPQIYLPLMPENYCNLKRNFNDSVDRVLWRAKIVIDAIHLFNLTLGKGKYHLRLEDDTPPSNILSYWRRIMLNSLEAKTQKSWIMYCFNKNIRYSSTFQNFHLFGGAYGLAFHTTDLWNLVSFLEENFDAAPLDWLFGAWASAHCENNKIELSNCVPSRRLISHVGRVSSKPKTKEFEEQNSWKNLHCKNTFNTKSRISTFEEWINKSFVEEIKKI